MSKELSPLEALEMIYDKEIYGKDLYKKEFDIIKNALKEYEKILTAKECFKDTVYKIAGLPLPQTMEDELKSLKALEIIKEKEVDVALFNNCNSVEEYNEGLLEEDYAYDTEAVEPHILTKKEFDLLKEVLK